MITPIYGTMEDAGGWRFFGGTYVTEKLAIQAIMKKQQANWLYPMKVTRIFRRAAKILPDPWLSLPAGPAPD